MKTTGATWNAYLASWPDGQWFDDSDETYDGREPTEADAAADAVVEFSTGVIYRDADDRDGVDLVRHFRKWEREQNSATFLCTVPRARVDELRAFMKSIGGKVAA